MPTGTVSVFASGTAADGTLTGWVNPTNVYSDDSSPAIATASTKNAWYGNLFSFDLSTLPAEATIGTVTLTAEWAMSANDSAGPEFVVAAWNNGTLYAGSAMDTSGQTSYETVSFQPSELTAANLRATGANGFWGVVRFRRTDNTAHVGSVDYLKVDVVYNLIYNVTPGQNSQGQLVAAPGVTYQEGAQTYNVTPQPDYQAQTVDAPGVTAVSPLTVQPNAQTQTVGPPTLTTYNTVGVGANAQAQSISAPVASYIGAVSITPSTGVLDDFNRANESPLNASNWGGGFGTAFGAWKLVSNQAVPVG